MKPSDKQNLENEKLKQTFQKRSAAWVKLTETKEYESGPDGEIIDVEEHRRHMDEVQAAIHVLRMFPTESKKKQKSEERRRKKANERRKKRNKRKQARERANKYIEKTRRRS